jgi:hypothetical protein
MRGLLIIYFQTDPHTNLVEGLMEAGVNVFIVGSITSTNNVLEALQNLNYNIFCTKPDVFTARKNRGKQIKLVFTPFSKKSLL